LWSGLTFLQPPTAAGTARTWETLGNALGPARLSAVRAACATVPVVTAQRLAAVMAGFAELVTSVAAQERHEPCTPRCVEPAAVFTARRFVEEHLDEPIALDAVAREAHVSRFHFCRLFRQWTGLTFTDFVTNRRLEQARALLADPRVRISAVALAAGFGSMTQFYDAFKQATDLSPTIYRDRLFSAVSRRPTAGFARKEQ